MNLLYTCLYVPMLRSVPLDFVTPMTCDEHEATVTKIICSFEAQVSDDFCPKFTIENAANARFLATHWLRSARQCAMADLTEAEFKVVKDAVERSDNLDTQFSNALKNWPTTWAMNLLPDVELMVQCESEDTLLEKAESQEWQAKLATLEAKLTCDYRKASEIASGMDLLKDALDWLATSKRVKQAQMARDVVQHTIEKNFPVMTINDYNEFSGELAQVLARVEQQGPMTSDTCGVSMKVKKARRLVVLHLDFNVPGVTCKCVQESFCWHVVQEVNILCDVALVSVLHCKVSSGKKLTDLAQALPSHGQHCQVPW